MNGIYTGFASSVYLLQFRRFSLYAGSGNKSYVVIRNCLIQFVKIFQPILHVHDDLEIPESICAYTTGGIL